MSEPHTPVVADSPNDQALIANVHPPDWVNPEPAERYHLVVVGAGTAGLVSAAGAAGLGARVALVERNLMGGDCLNVGCVPSKGVIRAARAWHDARTARERFGGPAASGAGDFAAAMERMRRLRAGISRHDSVERFTGLGIDVFLGNGTFVASDALEVGGRRLHFRRAIVATGARAAAPPIPGLDTVDHLTNETLFNLTAAPGSLGVIGAGPIGCEMAQSFARLGSEVHLIEAMDRILTVEEEDAAALVRRQLLADGVKIYCCGKNTRLAPARDGGIRIALDADLVHGDQQHFDLAVDRLLVSVGRKPNTEGLGLEAAGVEYSRHGVTVDDRLRTSNRRIFAVGDVASRYKFTHAADALARIAIQNALFFGRKKASDLVIPWCTYTSPELAHVGIYPREAAAKGIELDTFEIPMSGVDRAILDGADEGFLRVYARRGKDEILGATAVAEHAGDLIGEISLAMSNGVGLGGIGATIHPYPTQAEVIKKAGDAWSRTRLTPKAKKLFALFFRLFR
ncbi:MAG: mercuric reductase [Acidobacteriota bacterium]|nr:mercuric reductase [Acidobacteriota bacterium]MDH3524917.1 mercuric reductase [Acidobacteriota bacterium]